MRGRARAARARAFSLIELMIVVAIVGVLAVLAAYGVRKYIANAKSAEALVSLGTIGRDAATAYESERHHAASGLKAFCPPASAPVPASIAAVAGKKYQLTSAEWNVDQLARSGFACLTFTIDAPQYYQYAYTATVSGNPGDSFVGTANGDLDGDGVESTFQITGLVSSSGVVNIAPNLLVVQAEE